MLNWDTLKLEKLLKKYVICFDWLEQVLKKIVEVIKLVLQSSEVYMNGAISMWSISNINYQVLKIGLDTTCLFISLFSLYYILTC